MSEVVTPVDFSKNNTEVSSEYGLRKDQQDSSSNTMKFHRGIGIATPEAETQNIDIRSMQTGVVVYNGTSGTVGSGSPGTGSDTGPTIGQDATVTITLENTSTTYKHKRNTARTSGGGAITYNGGISVGNETISNTSSFTGEKSFTLSYGGTGDQFDVGVSVLDNTTSAVLSAVTFNVTVE